VEEFGMIGGASFETRPFGTLLRMRRVFVAQRKVLMLRRPRSGRLEARTALIQRFLHTLFRGDDT
jgi:hypothetical protein